MSYIDNNIYSKSMDSHINRLILSVSCLHLALSYSVDVL